MAKHKLVDMDISAVAGVDRAANMRKFLVIKRANDASGRDDREAFLPLEKLFEAMSTREKMKLLTKGLFGSGRDDEEGSKDLNAIAQVLQQCFNTLVGSSVGGGVNKAGRKISGNRLEMLRQMKTMLDQMITEAKPPDNGGNVDKRGEENNLPITEEVRKSLPAEVQAYLEELEKGAASNSPAPESNTGGQEDIWKGTNPVIRKMMEDMEKRANDAETLAKAIQEEQKNKEYFAKAASFSCLGVSTDDVVALLKAYDGNPELTAKVEGVLKAANEQISKGALFAEFGRSGGSGAGGDALAKAEALAGEMVQKNAGGITKEQALTKVWQSNPDLYKQYLVEKKELLRRMS